MPTGTSITITIGGVDYTNSVLFSSATFDTAMGGTPGSCQFIIRDADQVLSFTTGDEIVLELDSVRLWGGFVTQVARQHALPVGDTVTFAPYPNYRLRQWVIHGVDYNILFDKRIIRNTDNYLNQLPVTNAGFSITALMNFVHQNYLDVGDIDTASLVDVPDCPNWDADTGVNVCDSGVKWRYVQQGSTWRQQMDDFAQYGAVYYINPNKELVATSVENTLAPWNFADKPRAGCIGFREFEVYEDITGMVNDAIVWGGSPWAGSGSTVYARRQNTTSISSYGRWQYGEVAFNDPDHGGTQALVNARANVIVSGSGTGFVAGETNRGLAVPEKQITATWFAHLVPGSQHIRPPEISTFFLYTLGVDAAHPFVVTVPLRQMTITFPELAPNGDPYVQFKGMWGLQLDDPYWLWKFLRGTTVPIPGAQTVATSNPDSENPIYGSFFQGPLVPATDGTTTVFTMAFPYITTTTEIFRNGLLQTRGAVYTESNPGAGEVTFNTAPLVTDSLWIRARTAT